MGPFMFFVYGIYLSLFVCLWHIQFSEADNIYTVYDIYKNIFLFMAYRAIYRSVYDIYRILLCGFTSQSTTMVISRRVS